MSSIVQTLNLRGVKNPEKVDAVGLQPTASIPFLQYGGDTQTRTGGGAFAELCLTTWLCRPMDNRSKALAPVIICMEQVTRLELATSTLARWRSTR